MNPLRCASKNDTFSSCGAFCHPHKPKMPSTLSPFSRVKRTQIVLSESAHQVIRGLRSETFAMSSLR
jgi:hypothetical protein